MDERESMGYDLLSNKERKNLIKALEKGEGRPASAEEKESLINWGVQTRLNQELIELVQKDVLSIKMDYVDGFLIPRFETTDIGNEIRQIIDKQDEDLKESGDGILKDILKDLEDPNAKE